MKDQHYKKHTSNKTHHCLAVQVDKPSSVNAGKRNDKIAALQFPESDSHRTNTRRVIAGESFPAVAFYPIGFQEMNLSPAMLAATRTEI